MYQLVKAMRGFAVGAALVVSAAPATAQFAAVNNYQPSAPARQQPAYQQPPQAQYQQPVQYQPPAQYSYQQQPPQAQYQPTTSQPMTPQSQAAPAYVPSVASTQVYAPRTYGFPRVAQSNELPSPTESVTPPAVPTPAAAMTPAPSTYHESYAQPTQGYATGDGARGNWGVDYASGYNNGAASCDVGCPTEAPACDLGCGYPSAPRRQWFAGIYGLYLTRAGDEPDQPVAYLETNQNAFLAGTDRFPRRGLSTLSTADANDSGIVGAELRFGSTFGCDPCNCMQPYAWEVGYWALDTDEGSALLRLPGVVATGTSERVYTLHHFDGLRVDRDCDETVFTSTDLFEDDGNPAGRDSETRILGIRVRQRFTVQNLELNFWRFGTPCAVGGCCGGGACAPSACDTGSGSYGMSGYGGYGACAPCRPPRRFFFNGLAGVRYMRIDDDFGMDWQFTSVDSTGTPNRLPLIERDRFDGIRRDDNSVIFSDFEADNELIGFQLGGSMNWLCGCRWNFFADTNFGVYGNNASVTKRVYGGGESDVWFAEDGGGEVAQVTGSKTAPAYVAELRTGVGYQLTCNCRLTAAYRFMGIGGLALGAEEYQSTNWANSAYASRIDTNNSIILHGLQTGVECKY